MKIRIQREVLIPEGQHTATLTEYREVECQVPWKEESVPGIEFWFDINGQAIKERCLLSSLSTSKLGHFLQGMGVRVNQEVDLDDLIGRDYQVVVEHNEDKSGRLWANITAILGRIEQAEHPEHESDAEELFLDE